MSLSKDNILILGLAASGKTTLANEISKMNNYNVIHVDKYRYYCGTWNKKPIQEFIDEILDELKKTNKPSIIETSYNDASDPTNARIKLVEELKPFCKFILIIKPETLQKHIGQIIDRSIKRACGQEEQGANIEDSNSRACLVIKCVNNYDNNVNKLIELKEKLENHNNIITMYKFRDEYYANSGLNDLYSHYLSH